MKRCSTYKDSGVKWIGEIPKHWITANFRYIISTLTDYTANGSFASLAKNVTYLEEGFSRLVRLTDLRDKLLNKGLYVDRHAHQFLSKSQLFGGELLMANVGAYSGLVIMMPSVETPHTLAPNMFLLKLTTDHDFFFYLLNTPPFSETLKITAISSAQPKLNKENVRQLKVILPPLPEQKAIASYLDTKTAQIDHLIQLKERKIELLKEKRQALINETVTKGLDPSVPMKDSGVEWIGEIPEHWGVKKMKYGLSLKTEKGEPMSDDIKISPENVQSYTGVCNNMHSEYSGDGVIFEKGDILFNKLRLYLAKIWFATLSGYSMGEMIVLSPNKITNGKYMFYQFFIQGFIDLLDAQSTGVKMPRVSPEVILNTLLCFPPSYEQEEIASYLNKQSKEIYSLIKDEKIKINLLKEYRQSLISEAVTGQIRVCEEDVSAHQTQNV